MTLTPFTYGDQPVRVVTIDGEPWFVASDLAAVLDLGNPRSSLALLDADEKGVHTMDTLGGPQSMAIVSESGMYSLILRSRKAEAKVFKRWITHEVIPSIRKTGSYGVPQLTADEIVHQALQITSQRVEALTARVAELEPKADAFDLWLSSNVNYAVAVVAKAIAAAGAECGQQRLFERMHAEGWTYRNASGQWQPKQTQIETKRLAVKLGQQLNTRTGEQFATVTVRITAKGAAKLATIYGVMPEAVAEALREESAA